MSSTIKNFWVSNTQLSSNQRGTLGVDGSAAYPAPATLTVDEFRSWTLTRQNAYLDAKGSGSPKTVTIGPPGGDQLTAKRSAKLAVEFEVGDRAATGTSANYYAQNPNDPVGIVAGSTDFNLNHTLLDARTFMSWRKEDQVAYLAKNNIAAGGTLVIGSNSAGFENPIKATLTTDIEITGGLIFDTGSAADIPYLQLPGSAQGVDALSDLASPFKPLDGDAVRLAFEDRPDGFGIDPGSLTDPADREAFLASFAKWHSAFQLEYIKTWGTQTGGSSAVLRIPSTSPVLEAFVSASDATKFYVVDSLDKTAVAKMSEDDQEILLNMSRFSALATRVGLAATSAAVLDDVTGVADLVSSNPAKEVVFHTIAKLKYYIDGELNSVFGNSNSAKLNTPQYASSKMPESDRAYFKRQLDVLSDQLLNQPIISTADVTKTLKDLKERYDRAFAFWDVKLPSLTYTYETSDDGGRSAPLYTGVTALDLDSNGNPVSHVEDMGVRKGYAIFVAQEKRRCELIEGRQELARQGSIGGTVLDAPSLVYRFQSLYNSQKEAEVVAETEEINQQNALLKTYAVMQDAVNEVLSRFEKADGDTKKRLFKDDVQGYYTLDTRQRLILGMFEDVLGSRTHPIEKMNGVTRPKQNLINNSTTGTYASDMEEYTHNQWSQFATRLSEAVTQLNQNSQLKMNEVNSLDKERNRHFELANGALSKLSETLQNIARIG